MYKNRPTSDCSEEPNASFFAFSTPAFAILENEAPTWKRSPYLGNRKHFSFFQTFFGFQCPCVCVCGWACMYICICKRINVCMYTCVCVCVCICVCVCMWKYMCVSVCVCLFIYQCTWMFFQNWHPRVH